MCEQDDAAESEANRNDILHGRKPNAELTPPRSTVAFLKPLPYALAEMLLPQELTGAVLGKNKRTTIQPRYSLADVLTIIPKTKRSQVELLVRSGKIVPAWPSAGIGRDRKYDGQNLFEIAI